MWISNIAFFYKSSKISNLRRWQSWKSIFRDFGWHRKNVMNKTKLCKLLQLLLIEGILHHPRCIKPQKQWDKLPTSTIAGCLSSTALAIHGLSSLRQGLSSRGLRFVVHRGTEGFGDRLQQLLMAMRYARATGRALVIDWRDAKCLGPKQFSFVFCLLDHSFWKNEVKGYMMDDLQILYVWNFGGEIDITNPNRCWIALTGWTSEWSLEFGLMQTSWLGPRDSQKCDTNSHTLGIPTLLEVSLDVWEIY